MNSTPLLYYETVTTCRMNMTSTFDILPSCQVYHTCSFDKLPITDFLRKMRNSTAMAYLHSKKSDPLPPRSRYTTVSILDNAFSRDQKELQISAFFFLLRAKNKSEPSSARKNRIPNLQCHPSKCAPQFAGFASVNHPSPPSKQTA